MVNQEATTLASGAYLCLSLKLAGVWGTAVDVVDLDQADLELRGKVAESGRLLLSRDEVRRVRFETEARLRWIELRPLIATTTAAYLRSVASTGLR